MSARRLLLMGIWIYTLASCFLIYEMMLQVSPAVMATDLMEDFGIGAGALGLMAACYFVSYTGMQIPAGLLFDRLGPRFLISIACAVCACGAAFFATTDRVILGALGRLLMGMGSAFAFIGVLTVASRWFHPRHFALLVGGAQLLAALGAWGGGYPLALAIEHWGWRHTTLLLAAFGIGFALFSAICVRRSPQGVKEHAAGRIKSKKIQLKEIKTILTRPQTAYITCYAFSSWGPVVILAGLWVVPYLETAYGVDYLLASGGCGMIWLGIGVASPLIGYLSDLIKRRCLLMVICSGMGFLCSLFMLYGGISFGLAWVALFGIGVASSGQILTFALMKESHPSYLTSTVTGINNMAVVLSGLLFQPLVGWILSSMWQGRVLDQVPFYRLVDYQVALLPIPICYLTGLILSLFFIQETYCNSLHDAF